jgi:hypothetical protein
MIISIEHQEKNRDNLSLFHLYMPTHHTTSTIPIGSLTGENREWSSRITQKGKQSLPLSVNQICKLFLCPTEVRKKYV